MNTKKKVLKLILFIGSFAIFSTSEAGVRVARLGTFEISNASGQKQSLSCSLDANQVEGVSGDAWGALLWPIGLRNMPLTGDDLERARQDYLAKCSFIAASADELGQTKNEFAAVQANNLAAIQLLFADLPGRMTKEPKVREDLKEMIRTIVKEELAKLPKAAK